VTDAKMIVLLEQLDGLRDRLEGLPDDVALRPSEVARLSRPLSMADVVIDGILEDRAARTVREGR
jgi:hypothetical protein